MTRKILFTILFMILSLGLFINYSFAANSNIVDNVRNVVGGTENMVEDGVKDITGTQNMKNNNRANTNNNNGTANSNNNNGTANLNNGDYNSTRTATAMDTNNTTALFGLSGNTWVWLILAIAAIIIIAVTWSYGSERTTNKHD